MATFDTPEPISVVLEVARGEIWIKATDRTDTVVTVAPTDSSDDSDAATAEQVRVAYTRGKLVVRTPIARRRTFNSLRDAGSVDVTIELPEESRVRSGSSWAAVRSHGRLGECRFDTVHSEIQLDRTGSLYINAVHGSVRVGEIDGTAVIKNDNGETTIGTVVGTVRMNGTIGDFSIGRVHGRLEVRMANSSVRIDELAHGLATLTTAFGDIEVGIPPGTAAKLYLSTVTGQVRNDLTAAEGPAPSDDVAEIRARTFDGDVVIRRSRSTDVSIR